MDGNCTKLFNLLFHRPDCPITESIVETRSPIPLFPLGQYYIICQDFCHKPLDFLSKGVNRTDKYGANSFTATNDSISSGTTQSPPHAPSQCVQSFRIEHDRVDLYIVSGVVNCFSCALDAIGGVSWEVEVDGALVPISTLPDDNIIVVNGSFLIIAMPDNYVQPGTSGRRDIICISHANGQTLDARLASPGIIILLS